MLKGIGISPGIVIGEVKTKKEDKIIIIEKKIDNAQQENHRFIEAIAASKDQIQQIKQRTLDTIGEDEAMIFEAHTLILEDAMFTDGVMDKINSLMVNAEYAVQQVASEFIAIFDSMNDEYMKEKAADIKDVSERVIRNLLGIVEWDMSTIEDEVIIVADDLTPSDTALLDKDKVLAFVTATGGKTSHTAILARILEIPAVSGISNILHEVADGDELIIDGIEGIVIKNPDNATRERYVQKKEKYDEELLLYRQYKDKESITKDGKKVEIVANIGLPSDLPKVIENGSEGIGLFRTEFLFMNRDKLPTEQEQYEAYKEVAEKLDGKPVVIRTMDIGGDKEIPYLNMPKEMNPFLGYRAIRLCLDRQDMFKTQLRALLRASVYGNIKIMFPMISSIHELREAKQMLQDARCELTNEGISYSENIEVGMMIEVPSAAMMSDLLAKEVDFFSIGTNDLIQYLVAVDRGNDRIAHLYDEFNPGVLRVVKMVIDNAHKASIWVGMCGEAASNEKLTPLLLAMGLDEFSVSASSVLKLRYLMNKISMNHIQSQLDDILNMVDGKAIEKYMEEYYDKYINEIIE